MKVKYRMGCPHWGTQYSDCAIQIGVVQFNSIRFGAVQFMCCGDVIIYSIAVSGAALVVRIGGRR